MPNVHLTYASANRKTGPIPVSTSENGTCPDTCVLKEKGCYAKTGPVGIHWVKVSSGKLGMPYLEFVEAIRRLPKGQLWRHNQAGDLPHYKGRIDEDALVQLIRANKGKKGFTYTHHKLTVRNVCALKDANEKEFTVNVSCETLEGVDKAIAHGLPAVVIVPSDATGTIRTPSGNTVVICPATVREDVTCATCALCSVANRKVAFGFPAHGATKKTVDNIIAKG